MKKMGMPCGGRRNRLGSLHGPQNEENFNGTHPAMTVALPYNSDVQLPYRLPICFSTHATKHCAEDCINTVNYKEMLNAAQNSQDAQAGYACDYQNKRAARSCNEVREAVKGHRTMHASIAEESVSYVFKRHVTRLCSDAYGKGIVRSQQESINLRVNSTDNDVLAAETFRTAGTAMFPGQDLIKWTEAVFEHRDYVEMLKKIDVDRRNPKKGTATIKNTAWFYGHRPHTSPCWFLSAYEFLVYWAVEPVRFPTSIDEADAADADNDLLYHAKLTEAGRQKVRAAALKKHGKPDLQPGQDYTTKEKSASGVKLVATRRQQVYVTISQQLGIGTQQSTTRSDVPALSNATAGA